MDWTLADTIEMGNALERVTRERDLAREQRDSLSEYAGRLRDVLRWYAERQHYPAEPRLSCGKVAVDCGERARTALEA